MQDVVCWSGRKRFMQALGWGFPAERFACAAVEFGGDGGQVVAGANRLEWVTAWPSGRPSSVIAYSMKKTEREELPGPEIQPAPKSTKHTCRAQVVMCSTAREKQVLFFTDDEAREWATTSPPGTAAKKRPAAPAQHAAVQQTGDAAQASVPGDAMPTLSTGQEMAAPTAPPAQQDHAAEQATTPHGDVAGEPGRR